MKSQSLCQYPKPWRPALLLVTALAIAPVFAQTTVPSASQESASPATAAPPPANQIASADEDRTAARPATSPNPSGRAVISLSPKARDHYQLLWGVDGLDVKAVESGQMIRFSFHVVDPVKAGPLNDKKLNPALYDERARVRLEIPTMEKVGQLRQSNTPEAGKAYWMIFSNKGRVVKPGDRVSVVIGKFRADGLYVR